MYLHSHALPKLAFGSLVFSNYWTLPLVSFGTFLTLKLWFLIRPNKLTLNLLSTLAAQFTTTAPLISWILETKLFSGEVKKILAVQGISSLGPPTSLFLSSTKYYPQLQKHPHQLRQICVTLSFENSLKSLGDFTCSMFLANSDMKMDVERHGFFSILTTSIGPERGDIIVPSRARFKLQDLLMPLIVF